MAVVSRYDRGEFRKAIRLDNGYLRCDAAITRVGVFEYKLADGSTRRELRLPSEVFKADSLMSFNGVALTDDHPPEKLDTKNTDKFQVGTVNDVRVDGSYVASHVLITKEDAIKSVEGGKNELSCGYDCELEIKPGVTSGDDGLPPGIHYDAIQRSIVGNHVALVKRGRAGREVSLRLDSESAALVREIKASGKGKGEKMKIDGVDYECSEQLGQAISKVLARVDAAEEAAKKASAEFQAEKARADSAEEKMKEMPGKIAEAVKERIELERSASKFLGEEKLDGLSDEDIMRKVVIKSSPEAEPKVKECDAVYLRARFDQAVEKGPKDKNPYEPKLTTNLDKEDARTRMMREYRNAWKPEQSA